MSTPPGLSVQQGLPRVALIGLAEKLLEVPAPLIDTAMAVELADGTVTLDQVDDADCIFLTGLYQAERGITDQIHRINSGPLPWPTIDADKAFPWIEARTGLALADSQAEAIRTALKPRSGSGRVEHVVDSLRLVFRLEADHVLPEPAENEVLPLEFGRGDLAPAQPRFIPLPGAGLLCGPVPDDRRHRSAPDYADRRCPG